MGKLRKKKQSPPHQAPPIPPDVMFHPVLLPYAHDLRNGEAIGFVDEQFAVPCMWDARELAIIHDGIREWLKHGTFDKLAALLKDDPFRIVHPVVKNQILHLASLFQQYETTDSYEYSRDHDLHGPLLPPGTKREAHKSLLTIFQGMWSDLLPINQAGCSVRIPADGRRGHGTQTVSGRGDHRASADDRK